ncbi:MAG: hypothetical protein IJR41_04840 [Atopobiaceae bacterium]|nr:hypothetical protein [Atopobiaceae bacterium]
MIIPATVNILGIPYEVVTEEMEDGEDGCISPRRQRITLRDGMCAEKRVQVYLHELVHGILDQLGYEELYEDEHLVQGLAIGLHQALKSG